MLSSNDKGAIAEQAVVLTATRLGVSVTSAVELDPKVVKMVGKEIEKQTGQEIDLEAVVDENVIGGLVLRVGNRVLDASVRAKLERLRKELTSA